MADANVIEERKMSLLKPPENECKWVLRLLSLAMTSTCLQKSNIKYGLSAW